MLKISGQLDVYLSTFRWSLSIFLIILFFRTKFEIEPVLRRLKIEKHTYVCTYGY